jgi:hypothetical protein
LAGRFKTQTDTNFSESFNVTVPGLGSFPVPFSTSRRASVKQDFIGFEAGHDIAVLNAGNSGMEWHFGVLAGYVAANAGMPALSGRRGSVAKRHFRSAVRRPLCCILQGQLFR